MSLQEIRRDVTRKNGEATAGDLCESVADFGSPTSARRNDPRFQRLVASPPPKERRAPRGRFFVEWQRVSRTSAPRIAENACDSDSSALTEEATSTTTTAEASLEAVSRSLLRFGNFRGGLREAVDGMLTV